MPTNPKIKIPMSILYILGPVISGEFGAELNPNLQRIQMCENRTLHNTNTRNKNRKKRQKNKG